MATSYTYSIAGDFPSGINTSQLQEEINADPGITPNCTRIDTLGDVVDIWFDSALSGAELIILNAIIAAHVPVDSSPYSFSSNVALSNKGNRNTVYQRLGTYTYAGTYSVGEIQRITAVSYMDGSVTNFSIRIEDITNGKTIAENTFTNDVENRNILTPIGNLPAGQATLEIQGKKSGGVGFEGYYVNSVTFDI